MNSIGLQAVPNQSLTVVLNNVPHRITLHEANGIMVATVQRSGITIISGVRVTAGTFILPYRYQENGNLIIVNSGDELVYYTMFGTTQFLYYFSPDDLAQLRPGG